MAVVKDEERNTREPIDKDEGLDGKGHIDIKPNTGEREWFPMCYLVPIIVEGVVSHT